MTEVVVDSENQPNGSETVRQLSSGQMLRQAREHQQITVQALAATLKVPVYKLQALEEDRWDALTDAVFTRSLALSVCRMLNIPAEPVLAGLPRHEAARLSSNPEGINAPFKEKSLRSLMAPSDSGSGNVAKIVVVLLIAVAGSAGLYFLPQWQSGQDSAAVVAGAEPEPLFAPPVVQREAVKETAVTEPAAQPAADAAASATAGAAAPVATAPVVAPVAAPPVEPAAAPVNSAVPSVEEVARAAAAPEGSPVLRFATSGDSWVQVRDADGKVVMEKMMKAGDVYEQAAPGRPLKVVVGNAGVTTLEVDGAAMNLMDFARNNVARFEVK